MLRIFLRLHQKTGYWRLRSRMRHVRLGGTRAVLRARLGARQTKETALVLGSLVFRSLPTLFVVAVVVAGSRWLDAQAWMPGEAPASPIATDLFAALAGFSGVFLGFYFTALGFIVQSVYTGGSRELRGTILRGRIEVSYVQYVVFMGVLSIIHLGLESLGHVTGPVAIGTTVLAGAVALVGASGLMTSGLRFLDPAVLASDVRGEFVRIYGHVDDFERTGEVSRAAQVRCQSLADVFPELALRDGQIAEPDVAINVLLLLRTYWSTKGTRTWKSGWWPPEVQRPDWFRASHSAISVALNTGTQLAQSAAPDLLWVERAVVPAVCGTLTRLLRTGNSLEAARLIAQVGVIANEGAQRLLVEEATYLTSQITDTLLDHARNPEAEQRTERIGGARMLDVWDAHGSLHVQLLIGVRDGWSGFAEQIRSQIESISRDKVTGAESLKVPLRSKARLADLVKRLRFETTVEGRAGTPTWYWLDFLAPLLLRVLHQDMERVEDLIDRNQGDIRALLASEMSSVVNASAARRTLEVRQKWETCRTAMEQADADIRAFDRSGDFDLPSSPFESATVRAARERKEDALWALDAMPPLVASIGDPAAEELLGHTYTLLIHRCVEAVVLSDFPTFLELFRKTFWLGMLLDGKVPFRNEGMREFDRVRFAVQPALDLMALSGLALIREEAAGSGFWEPVRREWQRILTMEGGGRLRIQQLLLLADNAVVTFGVEPRYFVRASWMQEMTQALNAEGISTEYRTFGSPHPPLRSLLQAATGGSMGIEDPIDVFAGYFLLTHPLAVGLSSDRGPGHFLRRYELIRNGA